MDNLFSLFRQIWENLAALADRRQIFFSARSTFSPFFLDRTTPAKKTLSLL
jgi:hypothetical protein